jgi:hypothetical protein
LVIEIKVPSHELVASQGLAPSLAALWPSYLAFVTGTFLAISLAFAALWRHASTKLLSDDASDARRSEARQIARQYRFGAPLYLGAFGVSFVSEAWSVAACLLLAVFFALWRSPATK